MYGGLFGDLPAAKNDVSTTTPTTAASTLPQQLSQEEDVAVADTLLNQSPHISSISRLSSNAVCDQNDNDSHHDNKNKNVNQQKQQSMIIPHRILPTSIMRPRQQQQQHNVRKRPLLISVQQQKPLVPPNTSIDATLHHDDQQTLDSKSTFQMETSTESINPIMTVNSEEVLKSNSVQLQSNHSDIIYSNDIMSRQQLELEEQLRRLNEEAIATNTVYNPMIPNDVLMYWEYQNITKEKEKHELERQTMMQQQEMIRQQIEEERRTLLRQAMLVDTEQQEQQIEGEPHSDNHVDDEGRERRRTTVTATNVYYQKIIQQERTMGMGRGNGLSNLPAWLIQKQRAQQQQQQQQEEELRQQQQQQQQQHSPSL